MKCCSGIERRTDSLHVRTRSSPSARERMHNGENPRKSSGRKRKKRLLIRSSSWIVWRQSRALGASLFYRGTAQSLINVRWYHGTDPFQMRCIVQYLCKTVLIIVWKMDFLCLQLVHINPDARSWQCCLCGVDGTVLGAVVMRQC